MRQILIIFVICIHTLIIVMNDDVILHYRTGGIRRRIVNNFYLLSDKSSVNLAIPVRRGCIKSRSIIQVNCRRTSSRRLRRQTGKVPCQAPEISASYQAARTIRLASQLRSEMIRTCTMTTVTEAAACTGMFRDNV